jgi:hypothetical protein
MIHNSIPLSIGDYFDPLPEKLDFTFVREAEKIERDAKIEKHPFFEVARDSKEAMILWTSQEAIITNPFSQILFSVLGKLKNVHLRSLLLPVVDGEHSRLKNGIAKNSHPWLMWKLCKSIGLTKDKIVPTKAIIDFIHVLEKSIHNPMFSLGLLGIGNELILLSEYKEIEKCFDNVFPDAEYKHFLNANIDEDETHAALIGTAAAAMSQMGFDSNDFLEGAKVGVKARIDYYTDLLNLFNSTK